MFAVKKCNVMLLVSLSIIFLFEFVQSAPGHILEQLQIPSELGEIKVAPVITDSEKTIICIAEEHAGVKTQRNVLRIIRDILMKPPFNARFITLEGHEGGLDTSYYKSVTDVELKELGVTDLRREMAEAFLDTRDISAVEYLALVEDGLLVYGMEDGVRSDELQCNTG